MKLRKNKKNNPDIATSIENIDRIDKLSIEIVNRDEIDKLDIGISTSTSKT